MNDHFAKTQAQKISAEIAALSSLCVKDLKLRWRALYDTEPPSRIRSFSAIRLIRYAAPTDRRTSDAGGHRPSADCCEGLLRALGAASPLALFCMRSIVSSNQGDIRYEDETDSSSPNSGDGFGGRIRQSSNSYWMP